jgi:hypothetical protein
MCIPDMKSIPARARSVQLRHHQSREDGEIVKESSEGGNLRLVSAHKLMMGLMMTSCRISALRFHERCPKYTDASSD